MMAITTRFKQTEVGMIPEDWEVKGLGSLANITTGKLNSNQAEENGLFPFFTCAPEPLRINSYSFDGEALILAGNNADGVFHTNYYNGKFDAYQRTYVITSKSCSAFLRYFLYQLGFRLNYLKEISQGTATRFLTKVILNDLKIPVPNPQEQIRIATVLSELDSKIDLNHQMNKTLESIVRALFRHWFIDFDFPNEEGMPYRSSGGEMVYSEALREEVPGGWRLGSLGDIADNPRRAIQPHVVEQGTPSIGLEHMPRQSIALSDWETSEKIISNKFRFCKGEILFGKLRPYFHKVGVVAVDGVCSTDILVIVPRSSYWYSFVLSHVSSEEFVKYTDALSTGTKMPRSNWEDMSHYELVIPNIGVANAFNEKITPLVQKILANILQSRILAQTRDNLLPKLMSGRIRVPVEVG
jgi:type I restriction enzyme S subunit